jgi:DnaK suppressor protein
MKKRAKTIRANRNQRPNMRVRKASTNEVLGTAEARSKVPKKWAEHYRRLIELRDRLFHDRRTLKNDAAKESPTYSLHMADAGTDSYDRDWALGMLSNEQNSLYEIEQALDRIRRGSYGLCEITGKRIAAIPWTRFSAEAEKKLERDGTFSRARLGARARLPRTRTESQAGEEQD